MNNYYLFCAFFVFLLVGCHNNSHLRTQRILEPNQKLISASVVNNLGAGERNYNNRYMFTQVGVLGSRIEVSSLQSNGQSEYGPYVGAGFDFGGFDGQSLGALVGYDYRSYLNQNPDRPLKFGGQIEINAVGSDVGLNLTGHMRPSLTTASKDNDFFYMGLHGILVYGRLTQRIQWDLLNGTHQDEYAPYTVSSLGGGATLGFEQAISFGALKKIFPSYQFQVDVSFVKNSFKTNFELPDGATSISSDNNYDNVYDPIFERESGGLLLITAGLGMNFFNSNIKKAKNINPAPVPWPSNNINGTPQYFDPETGLPTKSEPDIIFDPETGLPTKSEPDIIFDPETGLSINTAPKKTITPAYYTGPEVTSLAKDAVQTKYNRSMATTNGALGIASCVFYPIGIPLSIAYTELLLNSSFTEFDPVYVSLSAEQKRLYEKEYHKKEKILRRSTIYKTQATCVGIWFLLFLASGA